MISFHFPLLQGRVHAGQPRFAGNGENGKSQESQGSTSSHKPTSRNATALKSTLHADQWSKRQGTRSEIRPEKAKVNINQSESSEAGGKSSPFSRATEKMDLLSLHEGRDMHYADTTRNRTLEFEFESSDEFDAGDSDEQEGYVTLPKTRRSPTYTYSDYRRNEQNAAWRAVLAFQESRRAELAKKGGPSGASKSASRPESK